MNPATHVSFLFVSLFFVGMVVLLMYNDDYWSRKLLKSPWLYHKGRGYYGAQYYRGHRHKHEDDDEDDERWHRWRRDGKWSRRDDDEDDDKWQRWRRDGKWSRRDDDERKTSAPTRPPTIAPTPSPTSLPTTTPIVSSTTAPSSTPLITPLPTPNPPQDTTLSPPPTSGIPSSSRSTWSRDGGKSQ